MPIISSPLRSLITYVHGTVFLILLITKTYSDQFGVYPLEKIFLYLEILTWSPTLNLALLSLTSFLKSIYVLYLASTGFILIDVWSALLYFLTISSNLSIYRLFDI